MKAVYHENHDQRDIDEDYAAFWDNYGDNLLSKAGIIDIVSNGRWKMYWEEYASGPQFMLSELQKHLAEGPAYVGYYDPNVGSHHVNCIYAVKNADGSNPQLVMEPVFKRNPVFGTYQGKHLTRGLSYYQMGDVVIGTPYNYGPKNSSGEF